MILSALLFLLSAAQEPPQEIGWKQGLEYRIEARFDAPTRTLSARARIYYRNNSPDTLTSLWIDARTEVAGAPSVGVLGLRNVAIEGQGTPQLLVSRDAALTGILLARPLPPGESLALSTSWELPLAGPASAAQLAFVGWYPRVVAYDRLGWRVAPLHGTGEWGTYDVTLELPETMVVAATGVPVGGDAGWTAAAVPGTGPIDTRSGTYGTAEGPPCIERANERVCGVLPARSLPPEESLGLLGSGAAAGARRVRWYAEGVNDFGWSAGSAIAYEQGRLGDVTLHVLYPTAEQTTWGGGRALRAVSEAFAWVQSTFGPYPYPQLTVVASGTDVNGASASSMLTHLTSEDPLRASMLELYFRSIIPSRERSEAWLEDALTRLLVSDEATAGADSLRWKAARFEMMLAELEGRSEPLMLPAGRVQDAAAHEALVREKAPFVLSMLRDQVGQDAFARALRRYGDRYRLQHAGAESLRMALEESSGASLAPFFAEWFYSTGQVDYALRGVTLVPSARGGYVAQLDVERRGSRVMPLPVRLIGRGGEVKDTVLDGFPRRGVHEVHVQFAPDDIEIDPTGSAMDWNVRDNFWSSARLSNAALEWAWDQPLDTLPFQWRRIPVRLFPLAWWSDAGVTLGLQARSIQLGRMHRVLLRIGLPAIPALPNRTSPAAIDFGSLYLRLDDPLVGSAPRYGSTVEVFAGEGVGSIGAGVGQRLRVFGRVYGVYDADYLAEGRWTPERKLGSEVGAALTGQKPIGFSGQNRTGPGGSQRAEAGALMGTLTLSGGFDSESHEWIRASGEGSVSKDAASGWRVGARVFAGISLASLANAVDSTGAPVNESSLGTAPREHLFFLAGGAPLDALENPFVRSRGAPLAKLGRTAGGGGLAGFHQGIATPALVTVDVEAATPPLAVRALGTGGELRGVVFAGAGTAAALRADDHPADPSALVGELFWSAGIGIEAGSRGSPIRVRLEAPLAVSHPGLAGMGREATFAPRVSVRMSY
jgi:hypothetical protein